MNGDLDSHHRNTLEKLFEHPPSGNVEWQQVLSLLEAVGTITKEHNGNLKVELGSEIEVFHPPHAKDIDEQTIVDLRRMLKKAGFAPGPDR